MGLPSCRDVSRIVSTDGMEHAAKNQRLMVHLHLLMCRYCRRYWKQIRTIGEAARQQFGTRSEDEEVVDRIRRKIDRQNPKSGS